MRRFLFLGFPPFLADGELLLAAVRNIQLTFLFYSVWVKLYGALVLSLFLSGLLARHNSKAAACLVLEYGSSEETFWFPAWFLSTLKICRLQPTVTFGPNEVQKAHLKIPTIADPWFMQKRLQEQGCAQNWKNALFHVRKKHGII